LELYGKLKSLNRIVFVRFVHLKNNKFVPNSLEDVTVYVCTNLVYIPAPFKYNYYFFFKSSKSDQITFGKTANVIYQFG